MRPVRLLIGGVACALGFGAAEAAVQHIRHEYVELHMGVAVRLVLYVSEDGAARVAARAVYDRIAELEDKMSDYRPESEVRRLPSCGAAPLAASAELYTVLARALDLAARTDGAFDPTVGPYVALWRDARRTGRLPSRDALDSAAARVGWRKVRLNPATRAVCLEAPGMRLDLGGIAKGYILDQALAELRRHGVTRALLEAGGDILVGDAPPGEPGWRIAVPGAGPALAARAAALANAAVATSGDTEQFVVIDGVRYSHIVDPRTGLGLTNRLQSAVVAPDGITADGLATALTVLGEERAAPLLQAFPGVAADIRRLTLPATLSPRGRL
ncbi:MAG: FAD:protein FMN transferase [Gemmatimonadetes bacterium]|nr:FAD:protein FMN transferase [Gemmatimonadota bacterium]